MAASASFRRKLRKPGGKSTPPVAGVQAPDPWLLRARIIVPVTSPAIEDGGILIQSGRITKVGRWKDLASEHAKGVCLDLGDAVLLPGLVNAHSHLDYTNMAGQFPPPSRFIDWLKMITEAKSGWTLADYEESWRRGAEMLVESGTTTVADVEAVPGLLPAMWEATPLRVLSFFEMIGIKLLREPQAILNEILARIESTGASPPRVGLSPHAPYSTLPGLLAACAAAGRQRRFRIVTHVAESAQEFEMFKRGRGEMYDWLAKSSRDMSDCHASRSPVQHLEHCGLLGENVLAVHANCLGKGDAAILHRHKTTVVHCPRSHFYFRHPPFPLQRLLRAGVNLCLGTDSLASVYKTRHQRVRLDMFEEMRALSKAHKFLRPATVLKMATFNGAKGLGLDGEVGQLAPGCFADLVAIPGRPSPNQVYEHLLEHTGPVASVMINGRWVIAPRRNSLEATDRE